MAVPPYKITDIPKECISTPYRPGGKGGGYTAQTMTGQKKEPPAAQTAPGDGCPFRGKAQQAEKLCGLIGELGAYDKH